MWTRQAWMVGVWASVAFAIVSLGMNHGQDSTPEKKSPPRDLSKLPPLQRQMELSAQRGADWLFRANRPDGRFVNGTIPALQKVMESDDYLRQAGAAFALARAGRHTGQERYLARARQAVLVLLLDTAQSPTDPKLRHTTLPPTVVNRLAAAGMLLLAIHELPDPGTDLLEQADQLAAYIVRQQRPDGSLRLDELDEAANASSEHAALALAGLMRSRHPPPPRFEVLRKALAVYGPAWRTRQDLDLVLRSVSAFAEAHIQTQDTVCANFVLEMADWLCELQYARRDSRQPMWAGGFMSVHNGKPDSTEPTVTCADYAHALVDACRVAKLKGDTQRYARYRAALTSCLQFVCTLQYTESSTTHFADWYKPMVLGGFHRSHQDGNLRADHTSSAVLALIHALDHISDE